MIIDLLRCLRNKIKGEVTVTKKKKHKRKASLRIIFFRLIQKNLLKEFLKESNFKRK